MIPFDRAPSSPHPVTAVGPTASVPVDAGRAPGRVGRRAHHGALTRSGAVERPVRA